MSYNDVAHNTLNFVTERTNEEIQMNKIENDFLEDILTPEELEQHYAEIEALEARDNHPMDCQRTLKSVKEAVRLLKKGDIK